MELQEICRGYLSRLSKLAERHGLGTWLHAIIEQNKRNECTGT